MGDEQSAQNNKPYDPMNAFRDVRDTYLDAWAKAMVETVNTESYAKTTGTVLDTYLSASSPFREAIEKAMLHVLEQLSMPSRADFIALAERATHIEMRLDDMDAKLDRIVKTITRPAAAPRTQIPRSQTKRAAAPSFQNKQKTSKQKTGGVK
ncbi:MAG: hypothetical protein ACLPHI_17880 [Terriglobales bacterium]|jgi:hypothetical protein